MKNIAAYVLCFILGISLVAGYRYLLSKKYSTPVVSTANTGVTPTPVPTLALVPPAQAVSAILAHMDGSVDKQSRDEPDFKPATAGATILLGESLYTHPDSSAVASISGIGSVAMESGAEVVFANMFPTNMVLQQKSGKVTYTVTGSGSPIAVRALHSLISIASGEVTVNIIDTDMSVILATGAAKLALVDSNNDTHVWKLLENQRVNIDDAARQAYFVLPRKRY